MRATRHTQPYRKGNRTPTMALTAMLRGRTAGGWNPQDITRMAQKLSNASPARSQRPARPPRPQRPPR
jgi:hypothetical protein